MIGSNVGGIPEIVLDNKTGFLFEMSNVNELSDKLLKAEQLSKENYSQFSKNARLIAEEYFNENTHYVSLITIYEETILNYNKKVIV